MHINGHMAQGPPGGTFLHLLTSHRSLCYNPTSRAPDISDMSPLSKVSMLTAVSTPVTTTGTPTAAGPHYLTGISGRGRGCCLCGIRKVVFERRSLYSKDRERFLLPQEMLLWAPIEGKQACFKNTMLLQNCMNTVYSTYNCK